MGEAAGHKKVPRNFSSKTNYQKWVAYGQMHHKFASSAGNTPVKIRGKTHKVNHSKGK